MKFTPWPVYVDTYKVWNAVFGTKLYLLYLQEYKVQTDNKFLRKNPLFYLLSIWRPCSGLHFLSFCLNSNTLPDRRVHGFFWNKLQDNDNKDNTELISKWTKMKLTVRTPISSLPRGIQGRLTNRPNE